MKETPEDQQLVHDETYIPAPDYYADVVNGARRAVSGYVTLLSTEEGPFQRLERFALSGNTNHNRGKEIKFLDREGKITEDVRAAVGVVMNNIRSGQAALFFRERFCQPRSIYERPKVEPRPGRLSDLPEFAPMPPRMSNLQAEQVARGDAYIDGNMRFRMNGG